MNQDKRCQLGGEWTLGHDRDMRETSIVQVLAYSLIWVLANWVYSFCNN